MAADEAAIIAGTGQTRLASALLRIGSWWVRRLAFVRAGLALVAMGAELVPYPQVSAAYLLVTGSYALFAGVVAMRARPRTGMFGLLALFADTLFFLMLANRGTGFALWLPWIFYFYLLSTAIAFHRPWEVLMVATVSIAFCVLAPPPHLSLLRRTVVIAGVMACAFSVHKRLLEGRLDELRHTTGEARQEAAEAAFTERQRIAADFHDGPLQSFISFHMRLEIMKKLLERDHEAGMKELQGLQHLSQSQVRELRAFVRSMRPVEGDSANLAAAVRRIAEEFEKESGIPVTFAGGDASLTTAQETGGDVLQMVREALHNVHKHAGATRVAVAMEKTGKTLGISIDDNGSGFEFSGAYTLDELEMLRLGPASLKRRARSLNAEMILESWPGRGAGLKLKIPI
jgi:signal transduction histidine kinase